MKNNNDGWIDERREKIFNKSSDHYASILIHTNTFSLVFPRYNYATGNGNIRNRIVHHSKAKMMQIRMLTKFFYDIVVDHRNIHTMSWTFRASLEVDDRSNSVKQRPSGQ